MEKYLNKLEFAIIQELFRSNYGKENVGDLLTHIPYIYVKERTFTGVGLYVNFDYKSENKLILDKDLRMHLTSSKSLLFSNFGEYFYFELDISHGKLNYIEIVTYVDGWNGSIDSFEFK